MIINTFRIIVFNGGNILITYLGIPVASRYLDYSISYLVKEKSTLWSEIKTRITLYTLWYIRGVSAQRIQ